MALLPSELETALPLLLLYRQYELKCDDNVTERHYLVYENGGKESKIIDNGTNLDPGFSPYFKERRTERVSEEKSFEGFIQWLKEQVK